MPDLPQLPDSPDRCETAALRALTRRTFFGGAAAALAASAVSAPTSASTPANASAPGAELDLDAGGGYWLGQRFWGNRLQDWITTAGRMECIAQPDQRVGRTVGVLTAEIRNAPFDLTVRTGTLEAGAGLSGFVVGTGIPGEDARRRALLGPLSGTGGGLIAAVDQNGRAVFREHTQESEPLAWPLLESRASGNPPARSTGEDLTLRLSGRVVEKDVVSLTLTVRATTTGAVLHTASIPRLPAARVRGGIALISSARDGSAARYWFTGFTAAGVGLAVHPERGLGPVVGTLFTAIGGTLRMTAQLMPVDPRLLPSLSLDVQRGGVWRQVATSGIAAGYTGLFYVPKYDASVAAGYRIRSGAEVLYSGTIPAEPRSGRLRVATVNCLKASHRSIDRPSARALPLAGAIGLDLYSAKNVYFPHNELVATMTRSKPDLVVAHGDQLYEDSPTAKDASRSPELDFLYKFLLWHWSMRPLTRCLPTVVLTDDHDVYQGNLWGAGGIAAQDQNDGGYVNDPAWVNLVQRLSTWHNPQRFDPAPIGQGISVGYSAFTYGGVSFALVEDRKFKSAPNGDDPDAELLGQRQEAFLATWRGLNPGLPKCILTQTTWACVQTDPAGNAVADTDSDGWPAAGRARAVRLAGAAQALILSGDQHLGHLVRHGLTQFADGPLQFTPPAGSTSFQRWFEPNRSLPNAGSTPHTGDFTDAFGNRVRVLAVANPRVSFADYRAAVPTGQGLGDRALKREGFGMAIFDHTRKSVTLECWPWNAAGTGAAQYAGWPVTVPYSAL